MFWIVWFRVRVLLLVGLDGLNLFGFLIGVELILFELIFFVMFFSSLMVSILMVFWKVWSFVFWLFMWLESGDFVLKYLCVSNWFRCDNSLLRLLLNVFDFCGFCFWFFVLLFGWVLVNVVFFNMNLFW